MGKNREKLSGSKLAFLQEIAVYIVQNDTIMVVLMERLKPGNFF